MNASARRGALVLLSVGALVLWLANAMDYGEGVTVGSYYIKQGNESSTLILIPDHTFQQELTRPGISVRAGGTWRRVGEGGVTFSRGCLAVSGEEIEPDGTCVGDLLKPLGLLVRLEMRQYQVLWYGRDASFANSTLDGTYTGDEEGVISTLTLKPDHTFEQQITSQGVGKVAAGTWSLDHNGSVLFSKAFLKTSGESLSADETALAENPHGSNLQIEISVDSRDGVPTFRKHQFPW